MSLANVRIVLVDTTHPGNIGAAARAMKNMCLERLYLVAPHHFPDPAASARASGATDILERATVCDSIDAALAGCRLVVGASGRHRAVGWPLLDPPECARHLLAAARSAPGALVFGRERDGLSNAEVDRCQYLVSIPSNERYSSLNLASAVQVLAYELLLAARGGAAAAPEQAVAASADAMQGFYAHLETVLIETGFLDPAQPRRLMRKLVRLFNRSRPSDEELNILRGILTAVQDRRGRRT